MENKRLKRIVKKMKLIFSVTEKLNKIILFGSYTRGDARENPDIDLFILLDKYSKKDERMSRGFSIIIMNLPELSMATSQVG